MEQEILNNEEQFWEASSRPTTTCSNYSSSTNSGPSTASNCTELSSVICTSMKSPGIPISSLNLVYDGTSDNSVPLTTAFEMQSYDGNAVDCYTIYS